MSDAFIEVIGTGKALQTYANTVAGKEVHSEAVTPTDPSGFPYSLENKYAVDLRGEQVYVTQGRKRYVLDENGYPVMNEEGNGYILDESAGELVPWVVSEEAADTGGNTSVASTTTNSSTILAANDSRLGATIYNDSTEVLYLSLGAVCTPSSWTYKAQQNDYYEVPFKYQGIITGVWAGVDGQAMVTELT